MTFGSIKTDIITLGGIIQSLPETISRAGLHKRFNKEICDFLWAIYKHFFKVMNKDVKTIDEKVFNQVEHLYVMDSSSWKISGALAKEFKGYTGAGCKLQLMIDVKSGMFQHLDITEETCNDQKYSKNIASLIDNNDLVIFDLGYATTETIKDIDEKGSFFICRLNKFASNIYVKEQNGYKQIDLLGVLENLAKEKTVIDMPCYIGNADTKVKVNLIANKVPLEAAQQRRRKKYEQARCHGSRPNKESLQLCDWTLFITNIIEKKEIGAGDIFALYRLRWSIELYFKQLKSQLKIHRTNTKSNPYRFESEVVGRCIAALFISYCQSLCQSYSWYNFKREISFEKIVKFFKRTIAVFTDNLFISTRKSIQYLKQMFIKIIQTCQKYRQSTRTNSFDAVIEKSMSSHLKQIGISRSTILKRYLLS